MSIYSVGPAGSNGQVQFNDNGGFGGDVDLTYNKTTNALTVGGDVNLNDGGTFTTTLQTITPTANRTISLPDATGTVALVAGSSGQLVYNNAGAQAGAPGSVVGATGDVTLGLNGAASTPPLELTGTWFTGGTSTTTKPQVLIEPAGTTSTAWSTSGTGLGVNATSGFTGRLLDLQTNGTSRAVVTGAGQVLVGTNASNSRFYNGTSNEHYFQQEVATTSLPYMASWLVNSGAGGSGIGPHLSLARSRGTSNGTYTIVQSGDSLGHLSFQGADGGELVEAARIEAAVDGTPGSNDMPGRLVFYTVADGSASLTERMRISQSGMCSINTSLAENTSYFDGKLRVVNSGTGAAFSTTGSAGALVLSQWHQATTGDNLFTTFGTEAAFTLRGSIDYNRAAGQIRYNVTSDRRLKSNIQPAASALDNLSALQVRAYKWTETDYQVNYGFVAQELNEVVPDAVKVGDDGEEVTDAWSIDTGKLVPLLTKALQEAIGEIESLKARLTAAGI